MKRALSFESWRRPALVAAGTSLIAVTYGLVRLAYGLFLPDVQAELGLSTTVAGYVSSGASLSYCTAAVIGFVAAGRRPRLLVLGAGLSAAVGAAGMASAQHPTPFAVAAVIGSAGAGMASPAMVRVVAGNSSLAVRERDQASVNAGTGPGLVAAGLLALVLLPDWRLAWFLAALVAVAATGAVLVLDRDRAMADDHADPPTRSWLVSHRDLLVATLLMGAGSGAVWNYGRTLLVDAGAGERASILAWVALGLGGMAVIGTARLLDRLGPAAAWGATTSVAAAATGVLGLGASHGVLSLAACAVFGWSFVAATGALIAWTSRIDSRRAPAGTSLLFVVLVLGQAAGAPVLGGLVASTGFGAAFVAAAVVMLAGGLLPLRERSRGGSRLAAEISPSS